MMKRIISIFQESPNSFEGQKEGEKVILLLRRHPFSIVLRVGLFIIACMAPLIIGIAFSDVLKNQWLNLFLFLSCVWLLIMWLMIFHALTIYTLNTIIITNLRIISNNQYGLFNRKIAELQRHRIQDVTSHVNGIIGTFLRFGDVSVQTAGSETHFVFQQVPRPEEIKDMIMHVAGGMSDKEDPD